ncbi:uncharacterized protein A1O5_03181 [Cladophialophora psammophila CBS 110553]|uniref:Uncharacterized protein n=1 Tax=Cladophialophora psammophila CBS 110553 TaxID=1182543 RepID=W9X932_9EURO|nr:uncharacterized protein A1O5_03181 [Cladophialophora psammophila CBS 110553]EXJ73421.1 hypothetical protein A1O5_03181 [Cladophialophora psammophila CBS 110553]
MESLVAHSSIPFKHVYTSDMFQSFKPNPKVYLGAAEEMGVRPEECGARGRASQRFERCQSVRILCNIY